VWFKSGGTAEWLFEPADTDDLTAFLREIDPATPVMALGLGSNLIVRDGGVPGVGGPARQAVREDRAAR
jgi:UDP-N-acetylmuramate dehydrogenase